MSYTSNIYIVRHGESAVNVANGASNQGDYSVRAAIDHTSHANHRLTDKGRRQAIFIAKLFKDEQIVFNQIVTSSMIRAIETMLIASEGHVDLTHIKVDDLLSERTWGVHDYMIPTDELQKELWENRNRLTPLDWTPRGGPSYHEACIRAKLVREKYLDTAFGRRLMGSGQRHTHTMLVSHSEFIWFLEREFLGYNNATHPNSQTSETAPHYCSVRQWQFSDGHFGDETVRTRSNSKEALDKFGAWTTIPISHPTREELWSLVNGHAQAIR